MRARSGPKSGCRGTRSTGGQGCGGPAGSRRWSRNRPGCRRAPRPRCWPWRRRSSGKTPARTAAQVGRILRAQSGWAPSERTLQRHFERLALHGALHGPSVAGRKTYLFAFLDDRSRAVMAARFGYHEDTVRLAAALRPALAARGVPESIYVDYADPGVMPTSVRTCCSVGVNGPMLSA